MDVSATVTLVMTVADARLLEEVLRSTTREDHPLRHLADLIEKEIDPCE